MGSTHYGEYPLWGLPIMGVRSDLEFRRVTAASHRGITFLLLNNENFNGLNNSRIWTLFPIVDLLHPGLNNFSASRIYLG